MDALGPGQDLRAAVDGGHRQARPRSGSTSQRERDVRGARPDIEHTERVRVPSTGARFGHEPPDGLDRQIRAAEQAVDPGEVGEVPVEGRGVTEAAVEVLPGIDEAAHRRMMRAHPEPGARARRHGAMLPSIDRRTWVIWLLGFVVFAMSGCTGLGGGQSGPPDPQPLTAAELRLLLIDELGPLWYCDRDEYPVGRDEVEGMRGTWPDLLADAELAGAVRERLALPAFDDPGWTDDQRLQVYRLWKMATAVQLEDIGNDRFRFDYLAQPENDGAEGTRTAGMVDLHGAITIEQQAPAGEPMCPICLSIGTLIDALDGPITVERLRIGDTIWTLGLDGRRVEGVVVALGSTVAPADHHVIRVTLADGRTVTASPGHPLGDGRNLGDLSIGDEVDGSTIAGLETRPYGGSETFDLVVSGPTGIYMAGGIPLRSTLE